MRGVSQDIEKITDRKIGKKIASQKRTLGTQDMETRSWKEIFAIKASIKSYY